MSYTFAASMFKSITAIFLICVMMTCNFTRLFIYAAFEMNQEYIASKLCENIDKPQLECNGKCYLMKKLKLAEGKEKSQERETQKNRFQEALITQKSTVQFPVRLIKVLGSRAKPFYLSQHFASIFHPPKFIS